METTFVPMLQLTRNISGIGSVLGEGGSGDPEVNTNQNIIDCR